MMDDPNLDYRLHRRSAFVPNLENDPMPAWRAAVRRARDQHDGARPIVAGNAKARSIDDLCPLHEDSVLKPGMMSASLSLVERLPTIFVSSCGEPSLRQATNRPSRRDL